MKKLVYLLLLSIFFLHQHQLGAQDVSLSCEVNVGGNGSEQFQTIATNNNGDLFTAGRTNSNGDLGGDIPGNYGDRDGLLTFFNVSVSNCTSFDAGRYGGSEDDYLNDLLITTDNEPVAVGWSRSDEGHVSDNNGGRDAWVVKFNANGTYNNDAVFGGSGDETFNSLIKTPSGFLAVGTTVSTVNDGQDAWVIAMNNNLIKEWSGRLGSLNADELHAAVLTTDNSVIVIGQIGEISGEIATQHPELTHYGGNDLVIAKYSLANTGSDIKFPEWVRTYGGNGSDRGFSIIPTHENNGFLIVGASNSDSGFNNAAFDESNDYTRARGEQDVWVLKINLDGNVEWFRRFGYLEDDIAREIIPVQDNKYTIVADTKSSAIEDGDFSFPSAVHGGSDIWLLTINGQGQAVAGGVFGGPQNDIGNGIVEANGVLYTAGYTEGAGNDVSGPLNGDNRDAWVLAVSENLVEVASPFTRKQPFLVAPNPVYSDHLSIELPQSVMKDSQLTIYNALGQQVITYDLSPSSRIQTLSLPSIPSGNYILQLSDDTGKTFVSRCIIHSF